MTVPASRPSRITGPLSPIFLCMETRASRTAGTAETAEESMSISGVRMASVTAPPAHVSVCRDAASTVTVSARREDGSAIAATVTEVGVAAISLLTRFRPEEPIVVRERRLLMGTDVTVSVVVGSRAEADRALSLAFAPIRMVDERMSSYRSDSELMQMNRTAQEAPVRVDEHLMRVLEVSREVSEATGGAFDVTCGPLIDLWRDAGRRGRPPTEAERAEALARVGYRKLVLDPVRRTVRFAVPGMKVVLGAVAKGYAVDLAVAALREAGYRDALVEAGGDLFASGSAPGGRRWRVGVQDPTRPDEPAFLTTLQVSDRAVVTSGNYRRFTVIAGRRYSHIVDPRTGKPVDALPSVTVVAPEATHADALATAVSVLGLEKGMALIESMPEVECLLVTVEGGKPRLHRSSGFARYEVEREVPAQEAKRQKG